MSEKLKRKTRIAYVGNTVNGLRRIVAIVPDEGFLEVKRYSMGIEASLMRRESAEKEERVADPEKVADIGKIRAGCVADELSVPLAGY